MSKNDAVKNAADAGQVKKAGETDKSIRLQELNDIRSIMNTPQGRRFINRLIHDICHYHADDFNHSGSITFKSLGERNIGRLVLSDVYEATPEAWLLTLKENMNFKKEN